MSSKRSALFLMANLGSEVSRLYGCVEEKEHRRARESKKRALAIIEELKKSPELRHRTEEVRLLADIIEDLMSEPRKYIVKKKDCEEYFFPFALRLMTGKI